MLASAGMPPWLERATRPALVTSALLVASLGTLLKLPLLHVGPQNVAFAVGGALLLARPGALAALRPQRDVLTLVALLLAWVAVAAAASPEPGIAWRYVPKSAAYALAFAGLLGAVRTRDEHAATARATLFFLAFLALGGVLEVLAPASPPFRLLRSSQSLTILPRIASFQPWPNAFGLAMVAGLGLAEGLRARGLLATRAAGACGALFLVQALQSGSRNAWAALALSLAWLLGRRALPGRRALAYAAGFVVAGVLLPVPAYQLGLRERAPVIEALVPPGALRDTSLADPLQSLSLRSHLWRASLPLVRARPWVGLGPGVFSETVAPRVVARPGLNTHNLALNLLVELGLVGLALAAGVLVAVGRGRGADGDVAEAPLVALLAGQFFDCFLYDPTSMLLLLLAAVWMRTPAPGA